MTLFTCKEWDEEKVSEIEKTFGNVMDVLKWGFKTYQEDIIYVSSFSPEDTVLLDFISKMKRDATIWFIDTNLHLPETYHYIEQVKKRYSSLQIKLMNPELSLEEQTAAFGSDLWTYDPHKCCQIRINTPLKAILSGHRAWISSKRRRCPASEQHYITKDEYFKMIKIYPLIYWTWEDVWDYINQHHLPYHKAYDKGDQTVSCYPCFFRK